MKRNLFSLIIDIGHFMMAGLGLLSIVRLIGDADGGLSLILVVFGILLGLLMWKTERKTITKISFSGNIKFIKIYVYVNILIIHILALFGIFELILFFADYPKITISDLFNELTWYYAIILLLLFWSGWDSSSAEYIKRALKNIES